MKELIQWRNMMMLLQHFVEFIGRVQIPLTFPLKVNWNHPPS